jgi:N-acylglucosamine 2-epimerase
MNNLLGKSATGTAFSAGMAGLRRGEHLPMSAALRAHLLGHVMPFWDNYAWEERTGSLCTCIDDRGVVQSRDKWLWSQWRAVWVYARLFRTIEARPVWLERARRIAEFCLTHGWLESEQGWALVLEGDGAVLRGRESTYTDAFAVYGLTELYRVTDDERYAVAARRSADAALQQLALPRDRLPHFPYAIPAGAKSHGVPMIWSLSLAELGAVLDEPRYREAGQGLADEVLRDFYRPSEDVIVEFVGLDRATWPAPHGSVVVPGHVVEDMWFQLHVGVATGRGPARGPEVLRLMQRHLELGWDVRYGGLTLALDAGGASEVGWDFPDLKLWWPQTEALYGVLRAWQESGDVSWLDWYARFWTLCLDHYVDWEHGEWRQKLNYDLTPWGGLVALPVKDPFHLPRSLILQVELLEASEMAGG